MIDVVVKTTYLSRKPDVAGRHAAFVTLGLMLIFSVSYWQNFLGLRPFLAATREGVFVQGEYWRVFTTLFVHGDLKHLLSNSLMLFIFSYLLRGYFGWILYPVWVLVAGVLANGLTLWTYSERVTLVGISGVIYLMAGLWLTLFFAIERKHSFGNRLLRCVGFTLASLSPTAFDPGVSYRAHAIGFLIGLPLGVVFFQSRKRFFRGFEVIDVEHDDAQIYH